MIRSLQVVLLLAAGALPLGGQQVAFREKVYPVLENAGCRNCHNVEGVASATRLHFPLEGADIARVEAFGKSLAEFVDRQNPAKSLLFLKPTLRIPHTGGERIRQGSTEEVVLKSWIDYLAKLSGPELAEALRYRQVEAGGYGDAPKVVLRRLTHSQYNHTVRDLLKEPGNPANQFPPEDYVNGFKNQYEALSVSPILADAYSRSAEKLAANAFRRGDSRGLIPCKPASDDDAACRTEFIRTFGRRALPKTARNGRDRILPGDLQSGKDFSRRRAGRDRDHAAIPQLHFLAGGNA